MAILDKGTWVSVEDDRITYKTLHAQILWLPYLIDNRPIMYKGLEEEGGGINNNAERIR